MNFNFKFEKALIPDTKYLAELFVGIWHKTHRIIFFILLVFSIILGGYFWHKFLYAGEWSFERKEEYKNMQNKEVVFRESDFKKAIDDIQKRKSGSVNYQPIKDIFKPYK